jgi:pimeloyl-ACP methyl ester carboxylesterase
MSGGARTAVAVLNVAVLTFIAGAASAQDATGGQWRGVASRQGADLPIQLTFRRDGQMVNGFITIPTMGAFNFPLRNVSQDGSNLRFELETDDGTFTFNGSIRGDSLMGSWNVFAFDSQISMSRTSAEPLPYRAEEVTCRNGNVTLAGTLSTPTSGSMGYPAVVFVHGSGPAPRQGFNFWADQFTRMGVASLVFDKRGSGSSTGNWRDADFNDLARDVLACVDVLKTRSEIDAKKIGLFGQSQGGWVAPLAASRSADIAFMVIVSGALVTPARQDWWEAQSKLRKEGVREDDINRAFTLSQINDEVTRTGKGLAELKSEVERARGARWLTALELQKPLPIDAPFRRFYRRIIDYDPLPTLQELSIPSLWIYGGQDDIIPAAESAAILERMKSRRDITVQTFPTATHTLWIIPKGEPFRWMGLAPGYVETVKDWVSSRDAQRQPTAK